MSEKKHFIEPDDPEHPEEKRESVREKLKRLQEVDVRTVDPDPLVDIRDVHIDTSLPPVERLADFLDQIKNPYCYRDGGTVVKVRFEGERTLEESISHYIRTMER